MSGFWWKASTRNHHVLYLDEMSVASVVRPQKHRQDGEKYDWQIEVLGRLPFSHTFLQHDPRDLESTKSAAEARTRWAIRCLYQAMKSVKAE